MGDRLMRFYFEVDYTEGDFCIIPHTGGYAEHIPDNLLQADYTEAVSI